MSNTPSYRDLTNKLGHVKKTNSYRARLDQIFVEAGFNLRFEKAETFAEIQDPNFREEIETLADFIVDGGQLPPLEVRPREGGGLYVVDGHRRRLAYLRAIEKGAPLAEPDGFVWIDIRHFEGNDADRTARIMTSAEGRDLSPLETAQGYKRLSAYGWDSNRIAKKVGKSRTHVEGLLLLANGNSDVQALVASGKVSAALAVNAIRKHGEKAGAFLASEFDKASAAGRKKVTSGSMKPKALPRAVVDDLYSNAQLFSTMLSPEASRTLAEFETGNITEGKVEVDAEALFMLIASVKDAEKAQKEQEAKAAEKARKAAQGDLEIETEQ